MRSWYTDEQEAATIVLRGALIDGTQFEGTDTVRVINTGNGVSLAGGRWLESPSIARRKIEYYRSPFGPFAKSHPDLRFSLYSLVVHPVPVAVFEVVACVETSYDCE